jgi:hypothetical protein
MPADQSLPRRRAARAALPLCPRCRQRPEGKWPVYMVLAAAGDGVIYSLRRTVASIAVCTDCVTDAESETASLLWNVAKSRGESRYHWCAECGRQMNPCVPGFRNQTCSTICRQRLWRRQRRWRDRDTRRRSATCIGCGIHFPAKRSDARFCSDTCRQRAHRAT